MSEQYPVISDKAKDGLSVAPPDPREDGDTPAADDTGYNDDVDVGSEDSMDASDPPSTSAPGSRRDTEQAKEVSRQQDA